MVRFSHRTPSRRLASPLAAERARREPVPYDLTASNPTLCDLPYPTDLLAPLADATSLRYDPDPRGPRAGRAAVAADLRRMGCDVRPEQVILTASTSEAYGFLARLLADPGDGFLVPVPSYPLFEQLLRLDAVRAEPYLLDPNDGWCLDRAAVEAAPSDVRAVVAVHPNNPTGTMVGAGDRAWLKGHCRRRGRALIVDEVFLPFTFREQEMRTFAGSTECLTFVLGGLSKQAGLPQLKLSWIVASGPEPLLLEALDRLDWVADAYLSVGTPVARALPSLLRATEAVRRAIVDRCRRNLSSLHHLARDAPWGTPGAPAGGWSVLLRVPRILDDEALALRLLERGVAVHPGYLFDLPDDGWLVLSLLPEPHVFDEGARRVLGTVREIVGESR